MNARVRHRLRLEPLESRLQPSSILTGIPELFSPGIELPSPETDQEAAAALLLIRQRRSPDNEITPQQPSIDAPAAASPHLRLVIPDTPSMPPAAPNLLT